MRDIELEEGEAYLLQDDYDDDENIDPDKDFSYIDRKLEDILGHHQKEFMGGVSAENLGARYGGYGSFLPMQQRTPPTLPNQRSQNHVNSKSPQDILLEHFHQNPTTTSKKSLPIRSMPSSGDQTEEAMSESGTSLMNNQSKFQSSGEIVSNNQTNKPLKMVSKNTSLKFRVKMASETIPSLDKSAIYTGLGLDMSPSSSPEGSPSENDRISTGLQEMNLESPSFILQIMTTLPIPKKDLLSSLPDNLVSLRGMESNLNTGSLGTGEVNPANVSHESMISKGKKEARKERKAKVKGTSKVKKSKHKGASEEKKSKQKNSSLKPVELMESCEYPANFGTLNATRRDDNEASTDKEVAFNASINAVAAYSEENERNFLMSKSISSKRSTVFNKKTEVGCLGEDIGNPMKPVCVARPKAKEEPDSAQMNEVMDDDVNAITLRGEMEKEKNLNFVQRNEFTSEKRDEVGWRHDDVKKLSKQNYILKDRVKEELLDLAQPKDKNVILISKDESSTEKRNEGRRENEVNKFLKQQSMALDKVKDEVPNSVCSIEIGVYSKENGNVEMIPKGEEVCFLSVKYEGNGKYSDVSQEIKYDNVVESLKQKSRSREMTHLPAEQGLLSEKENPSSVVKKNLQDGQIEGVSATEAPRSSIISLSASKNEAVICKNNIPSKSKKGGTDLRKDMRNNSEAVGKANRRKKGKELNSKELVMEISEQGPQAPTTKLKDKSSSNKTSSAAIGGPNMGDLHGVKVPVGDVPPVENPPVVTLEDWVECDKCHKWRLLPLGMSAGSFENMKWTCSMLTWLPGMNKCSFTEDETTNALYASYIPLDPASMIQNNQPPYLDANASVTASAPNVVLASQARSFDVLPCGSKKKNLVKTEIDAARRSGVQDLHHPVKKDQQRSGEIRNMKNLKKLPRECDPVQKSGDGKPSNIVKKRVADVEAYGASKKIKRVHQQPMEEFDPSVPQDFVKGSSKDYPVKAKDRARYDITSKDNEIYNVSGTKRKLKDKQQRVNLSVAPSGNGEHLVSNWEAGKNSVSAHRKEKKSKSSNFQAMESSADKGKERLLTLDAKSNLGGSGDSGRRKGGMSDGIPSEQYHVDRVSRKTPAGRTSSEMALDLGLSDNATTSSSSKISRKVKSKVREVKSSPVGSILSSPKKVSRTDPDKGTSKKSLLYSDQRPKAGAESAANEFAPHNDGYRDRRSNLSRNSGVLSDAIDEDQFGKKVSSGRYSHAIDTQPKIEDYKDRGGKADITYEGTSTSQQNLVAESQIIKSPNKLHFDGTNSVKGKSHISKIDREKEVSYNLHSAPEIGGSGSNGGRDEDVNGIPFRQVPASRVSLRQTQHTGQVPNDVEASSSRNKDNFHRAAKSALREATDLKHSANRMKVAGSGLESTGIFFQAALKFLHGASLLEPGNNQSRSGEMSPNDVYTSTAKLCEYCALEYERCNDMASAALAYKCMEVAYMRVVYSNDFAASRDRQELQMAVRAAPQVESPSSSASDIDNLNQAVIDTVKDGLSAMDHRSHVVSAGNRPNVMRLLDFTHDVNLAMEASRRSQSAFAAAKPIFTQSGNEHGINSIKSVLDFSFHDVDGLLHLVRQAMESIKS
ncbi:uncharacterized protein LOC110708641 [Chenopodium quinoa]|uniref:uncharacterized protein LOC110708641 n=1 Tax=Chenopodium quinoa TaxID=63459 RepID=UPI000B7853BC|nr:uncharacterized protein LOC110708641 [Chenopodium quinoa]XP_021742512.1 uncharacterized protein LOC110708641 [Chenopodium quinoa]XP_021742513.1 uncharacterized protein LOC110708641 [Chenopodium quinoa]